MRNFVYDIGTKVFFGEGSLSRLPAAIAPVARRVLLVYGGGSIKKSGLYDEVTAGLRAAGIEWVELSGVDPNPRVESVNEGARLCREAGVEAVLAVGGGSVIDCAKVIAGATFHDGDAWELVTRKASYTRFLPIFTVLTLSATGSEMDAVAVISNMQTNDKIGTGHPDMRPRASVLDPRYTFSVSKYQTAAGTADIMSHVFEVYFSPVKTAYISDRLAEGVLKTCIEFGVRAYERPDDYDARANLMWASSLAINNLLTYGKNTGWSVHSMEHQLSAYYDITHGVGLAILTPAWMRYVLSDATVDKFAEYGVNVWGIAPHGEKYAIAREAIDRTEAYFRALGIPATLREVGIGEEKLAVMAEKAAAGLGEIFVPLTADDVLAIYRACL